MKYKMLRLLPLSIVYVLTTVSSSQSQPTIAEKAGMHAPSRPYRVQPSTPPHGREKPRLTVAEIEKKRKQGTAFFGLQLDSTGHIRPFEAGLLSDRAHEEPALRTRNRRGSKEKDVITGFELTEDINKISNSDPDNFLYYGSRTFAVIKGVSYFAADDGIHGRELWRSDGTSKGTYLFKDLNPGEAASNPSEITAVGDRIFFSAYSATYGQELWVSDGTPAGTKMVADFIPGEQGSNPTQITAGIDNSVFFVGSSAQYNYNVQLWKTDGTAAGTLLLRTLETGFYSSIYALVTVNNSLFFAVASFGPNGPQSELWHSDGSTHRTFPVKNFGPDFWGLMHLTAYENKLYFSADDGSGRKLWVSDGSSLGTIPAAGDNGVTLTVYYYSNRLIPFQQIDNSLLVFGYSPIEGYGIYKYNNGSGMQPIQNFATSYYVPIVQSDIVENNGVVYFKVTKSDDGIWLHDELWKSDGTPANTKLIKAFAPGNDQYSAGFSRFDLYPHQDKIYFINYEMAAGLEPWVTDGTTAGTQRIKDIFQGADGSYPAFFTSVNGKLIFRAQDENGSDLWITNGTDKGTNVLKNINTHSTASSYAGAYSVMVPLAESVIFMADDGIHGYEMYRSDGSKKGTYMLFDAAPEPRQSSSPSALIAKNKYVYYLTSLYNSTSNVYRLFRTDGTVKNTKKIFDFDRSNFVTYNVSDNGLIYYAQNQFQPGTYALWRTDGTVAGTYKLSDNFSPGSQIVVSGNDAYFVATTLASGYELWKTDGSVLGTVMVKDIFPGSVGSYPYSLFPFKGEVYFAASDGSGAYSFWKSNGTAQGTRKLSNITPAQNNLFAVSNGLLYLSAVDYYATSFQGNELWRTDGTPEGTKLVKDINPTASASPHSLIDVSGRLFFLADDGIHGYELWSTDGTEPGTRIASDITPGATPSSYSGLTSAGGRLFFLTDQYGADETLWSSDGTEANTKPVADEALDDITFVTTLVGAGNKLFLSGSSYAFGTELYATSIKLKPHRPTNELAADISAQVENLPGSVTLFPNPAASAAVLQLDSKIAKVDVSITDISGKLVWKKTYTNVSRIILPVENLATGLYAVTIKHATEVKTFKLIKR